MKKKFVLVLALVLLVAATVSAADIKFTGSFKAGYAFTWKDGGFTATPKGIDSTLANEESYIYLKVADPDSMWTITLKALPSLNEAAKVKANASISLDKALKAQGVDMGDVTAALSVGANSNMSGLNVYTDPTGNMSYYGWKLRSDATYSTGLTVGYGKLISANLAVDPAVDTANEFHFVASVSANPIDGVSVAAGYANAYQNKHDSSATGKNAIDGSVKIDVAKLASLDGISLDFSAHDVYYMQTSTGASYKKNYLSAAVEMGVEKDINVSGYAEFVRFAGVNGLNTSVSYDGFKDANLYVEYDIADFSDAVNNMYIGGGASYTMSKVKYALDMGYDTSDSSFVLKPTAKITW
ncbi:MAG: hypothetical protein WC159_12425 [Sphaerochaetaceae bacterium]